VFFFKKNNQISVQNDYLKKLCASPTLSVIPDICFTWSLKSIEGIPSVPHPVAMTVFAEVVGRFSGGVQTGLTMELKVKGVANFNKAISYPTRRCNAKATH